VSCRDVLPVLRDYVDRELDPGEAEGVATHVAACPDCAARVQAEQDLKALLRRRVRPGPAPSPLLSAARRRLQAEARARAAPRRGRRLLVGALATAVVLGALGALYVSSGAGSPGGPELARVLVADHLRFVDSEDRVELETADPVAAARWATERLGAPVHVPAPGGELALLGGRRCALLDRPVALLFYEREGRLVSLFVLSAEGLAARPGERTEAGHVVRCWRDAGLVYAVVAERAGPGLPGPAD